jgi:hypothetical protein
MDRLAAVMKHSDDGNEVAARDEVCAVRETSEQSPPYRLVDDWKMRGHAGNTAEEVIELIE